MSQPKIQPQFITQLRVARGSFLLALLVIMLGAWVRLSDAGLGCPDWPGCYGQLLVPESQQAQEISALYPDRPLQTTKAWKEMIHRYLAGTLGLAIATLAWLSWRCRGFPGQPKVLPGLLLGTVIFQALLGMWTVTLLVKPLIVTSHLFGGMATLSMLWLLNMQLSERGRGTAVLSAVTPLRSRLLPAATATLIVLLIQIFLGGWTSTNYAAIGCTEFPTCNNGRWWPDTDFAEAFVLWRGLGIDYEFGVLEYPARTAIHLSHRIGALVTAACIGLLGWRLLRAGDSAALRRPAWCLLILLLLQLGLGISNVIAQLPLPVAVAHNGVAALLLVTLLDLIRRLWSAGTVALSTDSIPSAVTRTH